jgi:hypothetical protein
MALPSYEDGQPIGDTSIGIHLKPDLIPGVFPTSPCTKVSEFHDCVGMQGCNWPVTFRFVCDSVFVA